jgi:futalosine hydrolase
MRVIITAATNLELDGCAKKASQVFKKSKLKISFHATGIGMLSSGVKLTQLATTHKPNLIIQMGIAGSYSKKEPLGKVMIIASESIADLGVRENDTFKDLFETGLQKENEVPFKKRKLINQGVKKVNLLKTNTAAAVTINEITTSAKRIKEIIAAHNPVLESMEGAALHYVGCLTKTPFIQIRAISNYVGERNKAKWKIKESIEQLEAYVITYLAALENSLNK